MMSTRERAKAAERALKNARTLCNRQRRNMKAFLSVIHGARVALEDGDTLRAMALLSGNFKYPPGLLEDYTECKHPDDRVFIRQVCLDCNEIIMGDSSNG